MRMLLVLVVLAALSLSAVHAEKSPTEASITANESGLSLGDSVTFTTTIPKLKGSEWPMVSVWCYQDGLVYMQLAHPGETFVLGGGSSDWVSGPADCTAYLHAYSNRGGITEVRTLASVVLA